MSNGTLVWNEARDRGLDKWKAGEREHGGDLYRKPTLEEAIDEAIDLIPYLMVHRGHVNRALMYLKGIDLRAVPPAEASSISRETVSRLRLGVNPISLADNEIAPQVMD